MKIKNALTVDVEDYFHVSAFANSIDRSQWDGYPCRVESNTRALLRMFEHAGVKATFFVLGWVAERYPALVREIASAGHEVACHGYSHELVYKQFQDDDFDSDALSEIDGWDTEDNREDLFQLLDQGILLMTKKEGYEGYRLKCVSKPAKEAL